jgi:hypothetical protein
MVRDGARVDLGVRAGLRYVVRARYLLQRCGLASAWGSHRKECLSLLEVSTLGKWYVVSS